MVNEDSIDEEGMVDGLQSTQYQSSRPTCFNRCAKAHRAR